MTVLLGDAAWKLERLAGRMPLASSVQVSFLALFGNAAWASAAPFALIGALRRAARARAEASYSWDAVTTQYLDLWHRLGAGQV